MPGDNLRLIEEALLRYAQEMHEYTLQLWADSRKATEEKKAAKAAGSARRKTERLQAAANAEAADKKNRSEKKKDEPEGVKENKDTTGSDRRAKAEPTSPPHPSIPD